MIDTLRDEAHKDLRRLDGGPAKDRTDQGASVALADPELWPESVDGAVLLAALAQTFTRFAVLAEGAATAFALWTVFAHAHDAADVSPLLALVSPEKRCGKTTALTVLSRLVPRPLAASNITPAALFRAVEKWRPTLLVDEADSFLREREELRGILNAGHTRGTAYVIRTVGEDHEPAKFSTWGPKAVALIGNLTDTLQDRSIVVPMQRKTPAEKVERLRLGSLDLEDVLRQAARWAADHREALRNADPDVPDGLNDRVADNWRTLLTLMHRPHPVPPVQPALEPVDWIVSAAHADKVRREQLGRKPAEAARLLSGVGQREELCGPRERAVICAVQHRTLTAVRIDLQFEVQTLPVEHSKAVADPVVPSVLRGSDAGPRRPHEAAAHRQPVANLRIEPGAVVAAAVLHPRHRLPAPHRLRPRSSPHRSTTAPPAP